MSRTKPTPVIVADLKQAEAALGEMAAIDRAITDIETEMNAVLDAAKDKAGKASTPLLARRKELENAVATYATLNRAEIFQGRKSLDLAFGTIGYRVSTKIVQVAKVTKEITLAKLKEYGLTDGIRVKEDINKDAAATWPDERLALVGLKRRVSDDFFIEITREDVTRAA